MAAVDTPKRDTGKETGKKEKKVRSSVTIDMTPMVDIAFLLLIFFMVTTIFRTPQTIELNIPDTPGTTVNIAESNVLTLRMLENGKVFWNIGKDDPEEIPFEDLQDMMVEQNIKNDKLVTLIKIQRTSPYEQMVNIMDEMLLGAFDRFSITVMEADEVEQVLGS